MVKVKEFFSNKRIGFYVGAVAALLSIITAIVYAASYAQTRYWSATVVWLLVIGALAFVLLSLFKKTENLSVGVMGVFDFAAFLVYIHVVYMYLSEVFYNGFDAASFSQLSSSFIACTVLALLSVIVCNIGFYLRQSKK